ncbi:Uu.00g112340.m01.CDS01 [Anthostomella pinea]|uniref:Uu.00g112340.m01.CDS01 n=1 Tax=Anthostomella pinea TaxID=933095 RepID=A0AAI8YGC7_9PEZI|nr:Uu.00g112340.m01.CDS01 [Anthostomella pinea]
MKGFDVLLTFIWLQATTVCAVPAELYTVSAISHRRRAFNAATQRSYTDSFLGGGVINVVQGSPDLPAVYSASAIWNVAYMMPETNVNYSDPTNQHSMSQWVGILGGGCGNASYFPFFQAGTDVRMSENGTSESTAWVEWFPAGAHFLPAVNMTGALLDVLRWSHHANGDAIRQVEPGNIMSVTLYTYTQTTGYIHMINLSTGQTWQSPITADSPADPSFQICLGYGTAQFFVEWNIESNRSAPLAFNNITFSGVSAIGRLNVSAPAQGESQQGGTYYDLGSNGADYWNMTDDQLGPITISEPVDAHSFRVYSPLGKFWDPTAAVLRANVSGYGAGGAEA